MDVGDIEGGGSKGVDLVSDERVEGEFGEGLEGVWGGVGG